MRELNKKEAKLYGKMFAALGKGSNSSAPAVAEEAHAPDVADAAGVDQGVAPAAAGTAEAAAPVVEAAA